MPKKIILAHIYADDNKGDLGIIYATLIGLRRALDKPNVYAMSMFSPAQVVQEKPHRFLKAMVDGIFGSSVGQRYREERSFTRNLQKAVSIPASIMSASVEAFITRFKYPVKNDIKEISSCDMLICKGGSLLYSDGSFRQNMFLSRLLMPLYLAQVFKKPNFIFGQSIGPFKGVYARQLMRRIGQKTTAIYVRDKKSWEYLKDLGISQTLLRHMPDPAFLLALDPALPLNTPRTQALGVTALAVSWLDQEQAAYEKKLGSIIKKFLTDHPTWTVKFIPQVVGPDVRQDDRVVQLRILKQLGTELASRCTVHEEDASLEELLKLYSSVKFLLASRLHSSIFAAIVGTPAVVLEYQQAKAEGAFKWLGRPNDVIPWGAPEEDIEARLKERLAQADNDHEHLIVKSNELGNLALANLTELVALASVTRTQNTSEGVI